MIGMSGTQGIGMKAARTIIISGPESLASLRRFLGPREPKVTKAALKLWQTQASLISREDMSHMTSAGTAPENLLRVWDRQNADFIHETLVPEWVDGMQGAGADIERRMKRLQRKALLTTAAIQAWVAFHGGELVTNLNTEGRAMIRAMLDIGLKYGTSPYQLSQIIKPCVGLTDRWARAVLNRHQSLLASGLGADQALAQANKYAAFLHRVRALMIARTELAEAYGEGQMSALKETGEKIKKRWATADDERTCTTCAELDGEERDLNAEFSCGKQRPPIHPCDRCSLEYEGVRE